MTSIKKHMENMKDDVKEGGKGNCKQVLTEGG